MQRVFPIALFCMLLVGCGSGGNGGTVERSPDGKALIETEIGPDGAKVIEFTIRSGASGSLPAGLLPPEAAAEYARIASEVKLGDVGYYRYVGPSASMTTPAGQALPDVAGVPQRVERRTNGTRVTETFTYGTPPAAQTVAAPAASYAAPGNRQCSLRMTGGTGYTCVGPNG